MLAFLGGTNRVERRQETKGSCRKHKSQGKGRVRRDRAAAGVDNDPMQQTLQMWGQNHGLLS